jgi:FkbM family methyltransferase
MRVSFFLYLRSTAAWRWIRARSKLAEFPRRLGGRLVPESALHALRVRSGPSAGLLFELHPRGEQWYWDGSFERVVQERLAALTGPGTIFYDIGANFGFYSLLAAHRGAKVFAFEPNPANVACLARNARLNALEKSVEIVPLATYSATGHVALILPGPEHTHQHDMRARVEPVPPEGTGEVALSVPCVTLDEFARSHPAPSLVKLDVEGAELEVLRGAERLFEQARPRLICETHYPCNEQLVTDWLVARRYRIHRIDVSGREDQAFLFAEPLEAAPGPPDGGQTR